MDGLSPKALVLTVLHFGSLTSCCHSSEAAIPVMSNGLILSLHIAETGEALHKREDLREEQGKLIPASCAGRAWDSHG